MQTEKQMRRNQKKERLERQSQEICRIRDLLQIQGLLDGMGSDTARADFLSGNKGAVVSILHGIPIFSSIRYRAYLHILQTNCITGGVHILQSMYGSSCYMISAVDDQHWLVVAMFCHTIPRRRLCFGWHWQDRKMGYFVPEVAFLYQWLWIGWSLLCIMFWVVTIMYYVLLGWQVLTEDNLTQLDELYKLISPTREGATR